MNSRENNSDNLVILENERRRRAAESPTPICPECGLEIGDDSGQEQEDPLWLLYQGVETAGEYEEDEDGCGLDWSDADDEPPEPRQLAPVGTRVDNLGSPDDDIPF